jgi:hypothetical protein
MDHDRNIRKAACFLVDAFNGRLKNGLGSTFDKPVWVRAAFQIHMRPVFAPSNNNKKKLLQLANHNH